MPNDILAIASHDDAATRQAADYQKRNVIPGLVDRGYNVQILKGKNVVHQQVEATAANPSVAYIIAAGHGLSDSYRGWKQEVVFAAGNSNTVSGKIVHLLACDTAVVLGPDMVDQGCRAFFGYKAKFGYVPDPQSQAEADAVFDCDAEIDRLVAAGHKAKDVLDKAKKKFTREANRWRRAGRNYAADALEDNRDGLCLLGRPSARLVPPPQPKPRSKKVVKKK